MALCPIHRVRMEVEDRDESVVTLLCPRWPDCRETAFEGCIRTDMDEHGPMRFSERRHRDFGDPWRNMREPSER